MRCIEYLKPKYEDTIWVYGIVDGQFYFMAKVYDEGSGFGIGGGRVSKLNICYGDDFCWDDCFVNYDRGWDIEPDTEEEIDVFFFVIEELEKIPEYENRNILWSA